MRPTCAGPGAREALGARKIVRLRDRDGFQYSPSIQRAQFRAGAPREDGPRPLAEVLDEVLRGIFWRNARTSELGRYRRIIVVNGGKR